MMRANVAVSNLTAGRLLALFGVQIVPRRVLVGEGGGRASSLHQPPTNPEIQHSLEVF